MSTQNTSTPHLVGSCDVLRENAIFHVEPSMDPTDGQNYPCEASGVTFASALIDPDRNSLACAHMRASRPAVRIT